MSSWLYYLFTALALLRLRRTQPDRLRPYRAPLVCVAVCVVASVALIGSTFIAQPLPTICSLFFCLMSWPVKKLLDKSYGKECCV